MSLSGLLTADPRKRRSREADPSNTTIDGEIFNNSAENGFEVMLITNGLLPPFPFTMNRWFYQVKPVRKVLVLEDRRLRQPGATG